MPDPAVRIRIPRESDDRSHQAPAVAAPAAAGRGKPARHRNWTWFTPEMQARFVAAQQARGIDGSAILAYAFSEWAERNGF